MKLKFRQMLAILFACAAFLCAGIGIACAAWAQTFRQLLGLGMRLDVEDTFSGLRGWELDFAISTVLFFSALLAWAVVREKGIIPSNSGVPSEPI